MTIALWINRVLLTLLSLSTGIVKLVQMDAEMVLFRTAGVPDPVTIGFGVVQLVGGLLLLSNRTYRVGGAWMAVTYMLATGVVFAAGMIPFGVGSLLFVAMAGLAAAYGPPGGRA